MAGAKQKLDPAMAALARRTALAHQLLEVGCVLVVAPDPVFPGWWRAEAFADLPLVPAGMRLLGHALDRGQEAALSELRACLAEQRLAGNPDYFAARPEYLARLLDHAARAAAALAAAGVPLPSSDPDPEETHTP